MGGYFPESAFAPFYDTSVAFHGERPGVRPVNLTVDCNVIEDVADVPGEAVAPTLERRFIIGFRRDDWKEATPPQIGEWMGFEWAGERIWTRADNVAHMPDGEWVIYATSKPAVRGPTWLP